MCAATGQLIFGRSGRPLYDLAQVCPDLSLMRIELLQGRQRYSSFTWCYCSDRKSQHKSWNCYRWSWIYFGFGESQIFERDGLFSGFDVLLIWSFCSSSNFLVSIQDSDPVTFFFASKVSLALGQLQEAHRTLSPCQQLYFAWPISSSWSSPGRCWKVAPQYLAPSARYTGRAHLAWVHRCLHRGLQRDWANYRSACIPTISFWIDLHFLTCSRDHRSWSSTVCWNRSESRALLAPTCTYLKNAKQISYQGPTLFSTCSRSLIHAVNLCLDSVSTLSPSCWAKSSFTEVTRPLY